jgi:hypothetical protein
VYGAFDTLRNAHVAIKMIDLDFFERNQIDELRVSKEIMWYEWLYWLTYW